MAADDGGDPRSGAPRARAGRRRGQPGARGRGDRGRDVAWRRSRRAARARDVGLLLRRRRRGACLRRSRCRGRRPMPGRRVAAESGAVVVGGRLRARRRRRAAQHGGRRRPRGLLARYRKLHLWGRETELFTTGDAAPPVVDTPAGRIGIGVCYDLWFPEHARGLALAGADILVVPEQSLALAEPGRAAAPRRRHGLATAHVNRVHLVVADRCGTERGHRWLGASLIVDAEGTLWRPSPDDDRPATALRHARSRRRARQALG